MYKQRTPEDRFISYRVRERIDQLLKGHYQACMTAELPPGLLAVLKKLKEEEPDSQDEHV
jgi:hypothetical protein